jgi:hypothetical protein
MSFGIISAAALFYLFCVESFGLFTNLRQEKTSEWITPGRFDHTDWKALYFGGQRLGSVRLYSIAFVLAVAFSFGLAPESAVFGVSPETTPVDDARWVQVEKTDAANGSSSDFVVASKPENPHPAAPEEAVMLLDSNRNARYVLFDHEEHVARYDEKSSCVLCHHMNKPYDRYTGCYECHSDMYLEVNAFDHDLHVRKTGGNPHCSDCHTDMTVAKTRENTKTCLECHKGMIAEGSRIEATSPHMDPVTVGYMDALHGLCITCHKEVQESMAEPNENLSRCMHCHRSLPDLADEAWERYR